MGHFSPLPFQFFGDSFLGTAWEKANKGYFGGQTGNGVYRTKDKVKVCRWQSKSPFSRLSDRKKEKEGDAGCWVLASYPIR